jgi:lysyl-tRNA synthetase class 2
VYRFDDLDPFAARRAKLDAWRALGIDPYPAVTPEHQAVVAVREHGSALAIDEQHEGAVAVAGRLTAIRGQGGLIFADLEDGSGKLQLVCKQDTMSAELFERLALLDLADFIWASGTLFVTKRGELSLEVHDWTVLSKTLHPLPDSWKGLQDVEQRQRQRYLDMLVNEGVRDRFLKRSRMVAALRGVLAEQGFVEVETPILEHIPGGADAEPFVTHHNALDTDYYLRISLELHLKRVIVGGIDRVFELGRVFRNEGMSPQHLQEFTMLEFYWAYASYRDLMPMVQALYQRVIEETFGTLQVERGETALDFSGEWPRLSYVDLLKQYAGLDILETSDHDLLAALERNQISATAELGRGRLLDLLYKKMVRPHLKQPCFVVDLPVEFSPLAKRKADEPRLTERMVVVIDGAEVGNGFSELNDPIDQRTRLEEQERLRLNGDVEAQRLDVDFLRAMEHGMPPLVGFGVGIDRLLAVAAGLDSVRETVLFPTMRPVAQGSEQQ